MRPVNLLPERYRPARATGRLRGSGYIVVAALGVVLLMLLGYVITQNQINDAKEKTNDAIAQAQEAEARANELGSFGNFQQIKQQREAAVRGLALTRFDYERLMRELALVLPENVYLTTFAAAPGGEGEAAPPTGTGAAAVTATGPTLTIAGCAPSHREVAATVVRLRRMHNVSEVNLNSSTEAAGDAPDTTAAGCRTTWNAVVTFDAEAAPPDRPSVPLRLGGGA